MALVWLTGAGSVQADRGWDKQLATHLKALEVPKDFTVVVQRPFVVIGDEPARIVKRRAERTVGWAVSRLKKDFFAKDPDRIINVWLFKDKKSYE